MFEIADAFAKARAGADTQADLATTVLTEEEPEEITAVEDDPAPEEDISSPFDAPNDFGSQPDEDTTPVTDKAEEEAAAIAFVPVVVEAPDVLSINLNIFKEVLTDNWMCTTSCPCEDTEAKSNWIDFMEQEQLVYFYDRRADF